MKITKKKSETPFFLSFLFIRNVELMTALPPFSYFNQKKLFFPLFFPPLKR